uniref:Tonsoku-like protein n=1 Tax=Timema douglasi TaxID=61478 RepID=A0A7R8VIM7_TIMDO|nr:unnamed protein product [Timema douglasi]
MEEKLSRRKQRALEEVNLELLATTCKKLAEHYNVCGRYEEALQEYKEEESAWEALNKPLHVAVANRMIGEVYSNMGEFTKAIVHQKKHLEIARAENSLIEQQRALATIGRTYFCMAESMDTENAEYEACLDQAKKAYLKSLKVCERLTGIGKQEMVEMRARLLLNFGLVLECQKDIEKAIEFIQKSIGLCKSHDLFEDLYRCYSSLAMVFYRQKDTSRALCLLNKALETARRLEDKALHSCETLASKAEFTFVFTAVALCQAEDKLLTLSENDFVTKKKIYETLGDGCVAIKNFDKAIEYYHKMLEACKTTLNIAEVLELQGASYEELFDLYKSAQELVIKAGDLKLEVLVLSALISMQKLMKPEIVGETEKQLEKKIQEAGDRIDDSDEVEDDNDDVDGDETSNIGKTVCLELLSGESTDENEEFVRPRMARKRSRFSNKRNEKGETPLHTACISGKLIAVKTLLEEGHSVNVRDHCGWLPIHEASNHGFKDIVELLLDKGASINDRGGAGCEGITPQTRLHGETPLDCLLNWYERAGSSLEPFDQIFYQTMEARLRKALQKAGHIAERVIKIPNKSKIKPDLMKPSSNKQLTSKSVECVTYSIKSSQHLIENSSDCRSSSSRKPFHHINLRRTVAGKNSSDSDDDNYVNRWCNVSQRNEGKSENEVDEQFQSSFDISSSPTRLQIDHKDISSQEKNETEKSLPTSSRSIENINAKDEYVKVITGLRNRKLESEEIQTLRPSVEESHDRLAFLSEGEVGDDWLEDDLVSIDRPNKRRKQNISTHKSLDLVRTSNMYSTPTREYDNNEDDLPADSLIIDNISLSPEILDYVHPTAMNRRNNTNIFHETMPSGNQTPVQNLLLESHSDLDRQPYIDPSTRVSKHHKLAVTTPSPTSGLRAIKVRVEDMLFLVTVKEPGTQTIGSLAKEAAERCFIRKDMIPKLVLLTRDGAMLSNDDTLALIINEEEIHSSALSWDTPLVSERYKRFCKISQLDEDKRVTARLDDTQRTQRLSLKNLFLSYEHLVPIFRSLKLQNSLMELNLAGVLLQDEGVKLVASCLENLPQLQSLDLSTNNITSLGISYLRDAVIRLDSILKSLTSLKLDYNPLGNHSLDTLSVLTSRMMSLKALSVQQCDFTNDHKWNQVFLCLDCVEILEVAHNELGQEGVKCFLGRMSPNKLKMLNLTNTALKKEGSITAEVCEFFKGSRPDNLTHLQLSGCYLKDVDIQKLTGVFWIATQLEFVNLSNNPSLSAFTLREILQGDVASMVEMTGCPNMTTRLESVFTDDVVSKINIKKLHTLALTLAEGKIDIERQLKAIWAQIWSVESILARGPNDMLKLTVKSQYSDF